MNRLKFFLKLISTITFLATLINCTGPDASPNLPANRLDPNVYPLFQDVELHTNPSSVDYSGVVKIKLKILNPTAKFRFHAQEMDILSILLVQNGDTLQVTTTEGPENIIIARSSQNLERGEAFLEIAFKKPYNQQTVGLYQVEYESQYYLFTQLEAVDARKAFPCWDEPQYKIPWRLTLNIPINHQAISNTLIEAESISKEEKRVVFKQTKPLPSYLVALAVGPFDRITLAGLSVPGYIYTVAGKAHLASRASKIAAPILNALENYFELPYPYEKLDFIAVPEFWPGGMENAGMITYADRILLLEEGQISLAQKRRLSSVVAHEIAHQWFGNYVTMEWWDDLWLNESFADWMDSKIMKQLYPEYRTELRSMSSLNHLMNLDAKSTTKPVYRDVTHSAQIFEDLGLAYGKGTQVLNMVEKWVGPENFRDGVLAYLQSNAWGNARSADLWAELSEVSGKNVYGVLSSFITQSSLPLLKFEVIDRQTVKVSQERYTFYGVSSPTQMWTLPVNFRYKTEKGIFSESLYLDQASSSISFEDSLEWILPNSEASGYYRWTIPERMFLLFSGDPSAYLTTLEKISFLGNAEALLKGGVIDGGLYLEILKIFGADNEPEVLDRVLDNLGYITSFISDDSLKEQFASYLRNMLNPALEKIQLEAQKGEAEEVPPLRARLISWMASHGQDIDIQQYADSLTSAYLKNPDSIPYSMVGTVLGISAKNGDERLFDNYLELFESASSSRERQLFLSAMGRFEDVTLQDRALRYTIDGPLRTRELFTISNGIRNSESGKDKVLGWVLENYSELASRMPELRAVTILGYGAAGSSDRVQIARDFLKHSDAIVPGTKGYLVKIEEDNLISERLDELVRPNVEQYLADRNP